MFSEGTRGPHGGLVPDWCLTHLLLPCALPLLTRQHCCPCHPSHTMDLALPPAWLPSTQTCLLPLFSAPGAQRTGPPSEQLPGPLVAPPAFHQRPLMAVPDILPAMSTPHAHPESNLSESRALGTPSPVSVGTGPGLQVLRTGLMRTAAPGVPDTVQVSGVQR